MCNQSTDGSCLLLLLLLLLMMMMMRMVLRYHWNSTVSITAVDCMTDICNAVLVQHIQYVFVLHAVTNWHSEMVIIRGAATI